ncbi:hypothetical protein [Paraburkholderia sp. 40]|uniref:hypothetical protein n=1 Tax=Paraburkholderia sp. 40 TaxID=2991059 RepID=UPI003D25CFEA
MDDVGAGRRRALCLLGGIVCAALDPALAVSTGPSLSAGSGAGPGGTVGRKITDMIGANGWPGSPSDIAMWHEMGITWGRDVVGPGQPNSAMDPMRVDRTMSNADLPPILIRNKKNGIRSLLLLAFTPEWNGEIPGDSKSAPVDVDAWKHYVDAVVRKYSAPPYNLRHFQIWNEACGRLSGGLPQSPFWHGPSSTADGKGSGTYGRAMQDYVERIHIPAARVIRSYHAYVVYGGWPDQGGLDNYSKWLEYRSPVFNNERMLDWVDYIDTHYLPVKDLDSLYEKYVSHGPARGLWQTEIGFEYMEDPHYLPRYYFDFAVWALKRNWDDADKYVSMIYHWDGLQPFVLTHPGPPRRTYNPSGRSLIVLRETLSGPLSTFAGALQFSDGASGYALRSGNDIVLQVRGAPGWRDVTVAGIDPSTSPTPGVRLIDAVGGVVSARDAVALTRDGDSMKIRFKIPALVNGEKGRQPMNGEKGRQPMHLSYIVVHR